MISKKKNTHLFNKVSTFIFKFEKKDKKKQHNWSGSKYTR